ncbi:MBL fold metallo-hydrolase [Fluviispira multicolorata]|uniref:MBL fold metallo-hydrolase n=1 Tax=Fluviispira multicolorata TaxID=2654512 RepID=A0A833JGQ4_9BACT|nr:MBL fold metallo-hydrolase [Fluviispira multicolorata]KAB8032246.1 MBL fold metallo-hydrolase [Fluviispira multicolorata]
MNIGRRVFGFIAIALSAISVAAVAEPFKLEVYNPGTKSIFPVSSELIIGKKDVVLIDAQFQRNDAEALVKKIRATGKNLTTIFITHKDPDFYFGLDTITKAFPKAKVLATKHTVNDIKESMDGKLKYWAPILKENAPKEVILPTVLEGNSFTLEGEKIEVIGLDGASPSDTFLWIPSIKAALGGVIVYGKMHLWVADNQSEESRKHWFETMDVMEKLNPKRIVPGHFLANAPQNLESLKYTRNYLKAFEVEAKKAKDAKTLIARMQKLYPSSGGKTELEMSAKVIKGEMKWPM